MELLWELVPVGEALALRDELSAAEGLGEDVGPHDFGGAADDCDAPVLNLLCNPEVADVNVTTALGAWAAFVHKSHCGVVVLQDDGRDSRLALGDDKVPEADDFRAYIGHAHKLGFRAGLGHDGLFGRGDVDWSCLAEGEETAGVRLAIAFVDRVRCINVGRD